MRKAEVAKMPASERDKKTEEVGMQRFKQANAALKPEVVRSEHFMMFGNLPKDRADEHAEGAGNAVRPSEEDAGTAAIDSPEKISIYAFSSRKDFIEFIRTVESTSGR